MPAFCPPSEIRSMFSRAMSAMYRKEVPQYGTLLELVADVNQARLEKEPQLAAQMAESQSLARLSEERHGAIRLGKAEELFTIRRLFAVMGMFPVSYYDLAPAGIPVHSTAFRPLSVEELRENPFRVFTSLLRLELIDDAALRAEAETVLAARDIFTPRARAFIDKAERDGGLSHSDAESFVTEAIETFRWHGEATVSAETYHKLHNAHRLIADVVCFNGPHINHLTPRTLDIDAVQAEMPARGISPKAVIEGPPRRKCPILLRQTSFKALEEPIRFPSGEGHVEGSHTARFGEIEERGVALTPKGRALYDELLDQARDGDKAKPYETRLAEAFTFFPDDALHLYQQGLAYFTFRLTEKGKAASSLPEEVTDLVKGGYMALDPVVYEDFLPVSAAGIFQSNLGDDAEETYSATASRAAFEEALGAKVADEFALYEKMQEDSLMAFGREASVKA